MPREFVPAFSASALISSCLIIMSGTPCCLCKRGMLYLRSADNGKGCEGGGGYGKPRVWPSHRTIPSGRIELLLNFDGPMEANAIQLPPDLDSTSASVPSDIRALLPLRVLLISYYSSAPGLNCYPSPIYQQQTILIHIYVRCPHIRRVSRAPLQPLPRATSSQHDGREPYCWCSRHPQSCLLL